MPSTPSGTQPVAAVPHPGSRPEVFVFPFAEVTAAKAAIADLVGDLRALIAEHEGAADEVRPGFEGPAREAFEHGLAERLGELRQRVAALQVQLDVVDARTAMARQRLETSQAAIHDWERRVNASRAARPLA